MEFDEEDVGSHDLNRQGTKPVIVPMLGLPFRDTVLYVVAAYQCWIFRWQLLIPLLVFVIFMMSLCRKDHYAGRRLLCWLWTSARCLTGHYSGGTSVRVEPARGAFRGIL